MIRLLFLVFFALLPASSWAADSLGFLYSRSDISILRAKLPPAPLPWQGGERIDPAVTFDVEVRDAATMYNQKDWYNLSSPAENKGILMAFHAPGMSPVIHTQEYAPRDILLIDSEGRIIQIIPNITLSELDHDIQPASPVLAFLFLKGGVAGKLSIQPGDKVQYALFNKAPVVINPDGQRKPANDAQPRQTPPLAVPPIHPISAK